MNRIINRFGQIKIMHNLNLHQIIIVYRKVIHEMVSILSLSKSYEMKVA
jgi:hypothetical protein